MEQDLANLIGQLSISTLAVIACITMWRKLMAQFDAHLKDLRDLNNVQLADLRARVMVLEDVNHVTRAKRFDYLPGGKELPEPDELERAGKN
jgi:hypothetical protein